MLIQHNKVVGKKKGKKYKIITGTWFRRRFKHTNYQIRLIGLGDDWWLLVNAVCRYSIVTVNYMCDVRYRRGKVNNARCTWTGCLWLFFKLLLSVNDCRKRKMQRAECETRRKWQNEKNDWKKKTEGKRPSGCSCGTGCRRRLHGY